MKNAVLYKGVWLVKGSVAYALHQDGKWKELDQHMKRLDAELHALQSR